MPFMWKKLLWKNEREFIPSLLHIVLFSPLFSNGRKENIYKTLLKKNIYRTSDGVEMVLHRDCFYWFYFRFNSSSSTTKSLQFYKPMFWDCTMDIKLIFPSILKKKLFLPSPVLLDDIAAWIASCECHPSPCVW